MSRHLERLTERLKVVRFLPLELRADFFKTSDRCLVVQSLAAAQTDLSVHVDNGRMVPAA